MTDDRRETGRVLHRIADALGAEVADLLIEDGRLGSAHETLALLTAFERVVDRADRKACIDFVHAVAEGHGARG